GGRVGGRRPRPGSDGRRQPDGTSRPTGRDRTTDPVPGERRCVVRQRRDARCQRWPRDARDRALTMAILDGVHVLALSTDVAGAVTTMLLADHGAVVDAIEPPGGSPVRANP